MSGDLKNLRIIELLPGVLALLLFVAFLGVLKPERHHEKGRPSWCANNLKGLSISLILYSNDYKYFPHMKPLDQEHDGRDISKVFRTLIYFQYIDGPRSFLCPHDIGREQYANLPSDRVLNPGSAQSWTWAGMSSSGASPIQCTDEDPSVLDNDELSYTYLRRSLNAASSRSGDVLMTEKGSRGFGRNVAYADGHVTYVPNDETSIMQRLTDSLYDPDSSFLSDH